MKSIQDDNKSNNNSTDETSNNDEIRNHDRKPSSSTCRSKEKNENKQSDSTTINQDTKAVTAAAVSNSTSNRNDEKKPVRKVKFKTETNEECDQKQQQQQQSQQPQQPQKKKQKRDSYEESPAAAARSYQNNKEETAASSSSSSSSQQQHPTILQNLLERLRACHANSNDPEANNALLNITRARNLLEASAGNLDLAVMLHWEDLAVTSSASAGAPFGMDHAVDEVIRNYYSSRPRPAVASRRPRQPPQQQLQAPAAEQEQPPPPEQVLPIMEQQQQADINNNATISDDEDWTPSFSSSSSTSINSNKITIQFLEGNAAPKRKKEDFLESMKPTPLYALWGRSSIPQPWLQSGFTLSTLGLIPSSTSNPKKKVIHCPGITSLLSIVTAVLQSNACIQGNKIHFVNRPRFCDLNPADRTRYFHSRLADALSSLLFFAAKKYDYLLCPVCTWHKEERSTIACSKTNIRDIRSFVLSNLRSFTASGGIALFLETLCRLHGPKRLQNMLKNTSIISCCCEAEAVGEEKKTQSCVSTELISLMCCGEIYSNTTNWNANAFGIGFLSMEGSISKELLNPIKPVWIIQGPQNYYSTIWFQQQQDYLHQKNNEHHSCSFQMIHWNCRNSGLATTLSVHLSPHQVQFTNQIPEGTIVAHENDVKFYKHYKRWRFSIQGAEYKHYFQLSSQEKYYVDREYSDSIHLVLWNKWFGAQIDYEKGISAPIV